MGRSDVVKRAAAVFLAAFAPALAACGGSASTNGGSPAGVLIASDARGASVSGDQAYLAYYVNPTYGAGPTTGALAVRDLRSGGTISLGAAAFGASFGLSASTLFFFSGLTPALDVPSTYFGRGWVWTPSLGGAPFALTSGFSSYLATTPERTAAVFLDTPVPARLATGSVSVLDTSTCLSTTCAPGLVASDVAVARTAVSPDGAYAAYLVSTTSGGTPTQEVWLVSTAGGPPTRVASTTVPAEVTFVGAFFDFSPDGSMLATISSVGGTPMQLQVISTATLAPVLWAPQPAGTLCTDVTFGDTATLFTEALDGLGNRSVLRTTADSAAPFVDGTYFILTHEYPGTERYLHFTTADVTQIAAGTPRDAFIVDLAAPVPTPVKVGSSTNGFLTYSTDATAAFLFEGFDPTTDYGALVRVSLPSLTLTTVDANVYAGGAAFERGTSRIIYFPTPSGPPPAGVNGSSIVQWNEGISTTLESDALSYLTAAGPPTLYVTRADPVAIYARPLP